MNPPDRLGLGPRLILGRYLLETSQVDSAKTLLRESLTPIVMTASSPAARADRLSVLGRAAAMEGRIEEADSLLRAARPVLFSTDFWPAQGRLEAERAARLYESWGRLEEAAPYRAYLRELDEAARIGRERSRISDVDSLLVAIGIVPAGASVAQRPSPP